MFFLIPFQELPLVALESQEKITFYPDFFSLPSGLGNPQTKTQLFSRILKPQYLVFYIPNHYYPTKPLENNRTFSLTLLY
ncbi:hypothetical protein [Flavobacterium sp.]|uniref:hypothetical protein n=1 Tax=Flavobacterium sp. TaxID=239 RepID=UPI00286E8BF4|nr:hypothetical protein [Flavobacterium sp.]